MTTKASSDISYQYSFFTCMCYVFYIYVHKIIKEEGVKHHG
jgi:hypothetical protein